MISIDVHDASKSSIASLKAQLKFAVDKQFSEIVRMMFRDLVKVTPQWSGNYAANWYITDDHNFAGYKEIPSKGDTRFTQAGKMGDQRGVRPSINRSNFQSKTLSYKKPVYFINNTPTLFEEDTADPPVVGYSQPYQGANYPEITKVRPENLVAGEVVLSSYLRSKYG